MPTDLETLIIRERKQISLLQRMKMAKDAALGMNWLHSSNPIFIHRDLKLSNLLVCAATLCHIARLSYNVVEALLF
jgi:serine/threonine protein kinase